MYTDAFNMSTNLNFSQFTKFIICASAATFMISNKTDLGKIERLKITRAAMNKAGANLCIITFGC